MIRLMTASMANPRAKEEIKIKIVINAQNKTRQTITQETLIYFTKVALYARDANIRISTIKNYPIKLCARLTAKWLTTEYKSKIIKFKLDEYPLQRRIYFLTFVESMEMIFLQNKETCEVLLDYPKIGGENSK